MTSTHSYAEDPRNATVLVDVCGDLVPRPDAKISVLDAGFVLGDGIWEGLRLHAGRIAFLDRHLDRLFGAARAVAIDLEGAGLTRSILTERLARVLAANAMWDDVHVRLMVTRGLKTTPYQSPSASASGPTVVILPEWKAPTPDVYTRGLKLFTVHVRRGRPDVQDPFLNTHSKHNCIQACIQADAAGADEALMLDPHGFVATCNSTHFFIVTRGELWTSTGRYCLDGITRRVLLQVGAELGLVVRERDFSLAQVYAAEEAFVTGTFAGAVSVGSVDGRAFPGPFPAPITARLQAGYQARVQAQAQLPGLQP